MAVLNQESVKSAVGDVRCGSTKRVASAVGEGSVVIQFVHRRVAGLNQMV